MLRRDDAADLRRRLEDDGYLHPDYGGRCFARVPGTVGRILEADVGPALPDDVLKGVRTDVDHVVCLLLDGFGFEQWARHYGDHPFLERLTDRATVSALTSIFPSETAAALTSVHTGLTAAEHGLLGWNVLQGGSVVQPLPYTARDGEPPEEFTIFEGDPVYDNLASAGVESTAIQPAAHVGSPYSAATTAGAGSVGYRNVADMAVRLRRTLADATGPSYVYAYVPEIDAIAHDEGTHTDGYRAQLAAISDCLAREFARLDEAVVENTLLLVTADHGHVDTDPELAVDLWGGEWDVRGHLREGADGEPLGPTGSGRNAHLHVRPGHEAAVRTQLEELDALVLSGEEALDRELLGPGPVSSLTRERVGDLVVVHRRQGVWYGEEPDKLAFVGQHGGLTPEEMLVPFAAVRLDRL